MLPREIQEKLLDKWRIQWSQMREEDVSRTVLAVLEEVKEIAKARREQVIPTPMDISRVADDPNAGTKNHVRDWGGDADDWAGFGEWNEWRDGEASVNMIGKGAGKNGKGKGKGTMCYTCGMVGHLSWECPKGKSRGKGKGFGKSAWQQGSYWRKRKEWKGE